MSPDLIVLLVITIIVVFAFHEPIIAGLEHSFSGEAAKPWTREFLLSLSRRFFGYLILPLFLTYFGIGVTLLPSPVFRAALQRRAPVATQMRPYDGLRLAGWNDDDIGHLREDLAITILGGLVIVSATRMLIVRHNPRLVSSLVQVAFCLFGFVVFTYLFDLAAGLNYYRTLFDSVLRFEFPESLPFVCVASICTAIATEALLGRHQ
jgi:hypothetical protein